MEFSWKDYEGQTVNGYLLQEYIGWLDGRACFKTEHEGHPAIAQIVPVSSPSSKRNLESWLQAYELTHPNLVETFAAGNTTVAGVPFVFSIIEYVDDNVSDALAARPLTPTEARQVLGSVASALSFLHGKRLAHGCLEPPNIVATGHKVKLMTDCLGPANSPDGGAARDMEQLGLTLVQIFTQRRPSLDEAGEASNRLEPPFRDIAAGCLHPDPEQRWPAERVHRALGIEATSAPTSAPLIVSIPEESPESRRKAPLVAIIGAVAVVIALGVFFRNAGDADNAAKNPVPAVPSATMPVAPSQSPVAESARPVPEEPKPERHVVGEGVGDGSRSRPVMGDWAVVAATYNRVEDAERRSRTMKEKWPAFEPAVHPTKSNRYLVVLATGINQQDAKQLLARARSAGLPRDTYITRIR